MIYSEIDLKIGLEDYFYNNHRTNEIPILFILEFFKDKNPKLKVLEDILKRVQRGVDLETEQIVIIELVREAIVFGFGEGVISER